MSCCIGEDDEEQQQEQTPKLNHQRVRSCTDVFFLALFIAFWILTILIAAFAFVYGNPIRLINGSDIFGNICGIKNNQKFGSLELSGQDTSDKPYLFFFDPAKVLKKKSVSICVKKCPDRTLYNWQDICNFYRETNSQLCHDKSGNGMSICSDNNRNATGICPKNFPIYESKPILNRCIPKSISDRGKNFAHNLYDLINSWDFLKQALADLYKTWREILALSLLSFVLSLFMIAIIHLLASLVTWIVMVLVMVACISGTALLWITYYDIKHKLDAMNQDEVLVESVRNETAFFYLAIIASVITVIFVILIFFIRRNIQFMGLLLKESAKCLAELPGLFFQPLLTFIALLVFFAFWVTVFLFLSTSDYPVSKPFNDLDLDQSLIYNKTTDYQQPSLNKDLPLSDYKTLTTVENTKSSWVKYMWWFHIVGLIWVIEFICACQAMIISGAVAHWYFRGKNASASPVCSSMGTLFSYHLGSVACGSLLITIFKIPRLILTYLHKKFEQTRQNSPCTDCGLKCCICCFYCLERFIRYMNHNAYTVIAIEGTHFCKAARIAFRTIISNAVQVAVINSVGDFILFLGKCFVTAATGSIGLLFLKQDPRLNFYAVPIFFICVFAFFIAHSVISLYETVIDTLFLCVCEDKNLNGENGKWRQSALAQLISESNTNGQQSHELTPMQA